MDLEPASAREAPEEGFERNSERKEDDFILGDGLPRLPASDPDPELYGDTLNP